MALLCDNCDVAVVGPNSPAYVAAYTLLRRAGIATRTFLSGNLKRQIKQCIDIDAVVIVDEVGLIVRDMLLRRQEKTTMAGLLDMVRTVLHDGLMTDEEKAMSLNDYIDHHLAQNGLPAVDSTRPA